MKTLVKRLKDAVPGLTSGRLLTMAGDVGERADDLAKYADPRDYDTEDEMRDHVQRLRDAARVLGVLADIFEQYEASGHGG